MEVTISGQTLVTILTPLALIVGWLANSKASIILNKSAIEAAHKRLDRIEEFLGVGNGRAFQSSKESQTKKEE